MNRAEVLERISVDPKICFGKPCIKGHRLWVSLILDFLANGWTMRQILDNYPGLEEADIYACLAYGAEMSRERFVEIGGPSVAGYAWAARQIANRGIFEISYAVDFCSPRVDLVRDSQNAFRQKKW